MSASTGFDCCGEWISQEKELHINLLEMKAAQPALNACLL